MSRLHCVTSAAVIVSLSACAPALAHTSAGAAAGKVSGRLQIEGGPIGPNGQQPGKRPAPGVVRFTGADRHRVTVRVGDSGTFSVRLPAGRYAACARLAGGQGPCSLARQVTLTPLRTAKITFTFFVP